MDDTEIVVVDDRELLKIDNVIRDFERISGAILNRSEKSKIMGLGTWSGRKNWPLKWLKVVDKLKIFGVLMSPKLDTILDDNWSSILEKLKKTLFSWSTRSLTTLIERTEILKAIRG